MKSPDEGKTVCDGCWKRGRCENIYWCRCTCSNPEAPWIHVDNPRVTPVYPLDPDKEY